MGSITFTVKETGKADATKTYTVPDADIDRVVAAYQNDANVAVNGTATRAQVLLQMVTSWMDEAKQKVKSKEYADAQAAVPQPTDISAT